MAPDADAQPGELNPADGPGPGELLRYRSAQGRWVVAAMILGSSVAGIDSTVVAVALPAIGRNLHAGFQGLQWTVVELRYMGDCIHCRLHRADAEPVEWVHLRRGRPAVGDRESG